MAHTIFNRTHYLKLKLINIYTPRKPIIWLITPNIKTLDFDNSVEIPEIQTEIIDVNLESLIANLL